ncbi:MAG TPA: hypothetical protein PKL83_01285 [bacterium]|nr:hypothetical protein [bacterium]
MKRFFLFLTVFLCGAAFALLGMAFILRLQEEDMPFEPATACHAVWLAHDWIEEEQTDVDIQALADRLRDAGVTCVYLHTTPLNADGSLDTTRAQYLVPFVTAIKEKYPKLTLYAWMGILTDRYDSPSIGTKFYLSDYPTMRAIRATALELVDSYGLDGVHLDIEPVLSGSAEYLVTLASLHDTLNNRGKKLSVAVTFIADAKRQEKYHAEGKEFLWSWEPKYYETVGLYCDQIVIMAYNIGSLNVDSYQQLLLEQLAAVQPARKQGAAVLIGLPAYDFRYADAENLAAGLEAVELGHAQGLLSDGVSVYAEWTMDDQEWKVLTSFIDKERAGLLPVSPPLSPPLR